MKVRRSIKPGVAKRKGVAATKKPKPVTKPRAQPAGQLKGQPFSVWDPRPAPQAWWP